MLAVEKDISPMTYSRKTAYQRALQTTLRATMIVAAAGVFLTAARGQQPVKFDSATISGLPVRNIGSAVISGRVAAIDANTADGPPTVVFGSASGGVGKSGHVGVCS